MQSFALRHRPEIGGAVLLVGAALFLVLDLIAESAYPGFDARHDPLSRLGASDAPTRSLWSAGLLVLASSWLVGLSTVLRRGSRLVLGLNLVPVAGLVTAVLIPLDANLALHEAAAFTAFLGGILAVVANAEVLRPAWRLASSGLAGVAVLAISPFAGRLIVIVGWGGLERMVVFPLVAAIGLFGLAALLGGGRAPADTRGARVGTLGLLVVALLAGLFGLGTGLTAGGYEVVFGRTANLVHEAHAATLPTPRPSFHS